MFLYRLEVQYMFRRGLTDFFYFRRGFTPIGLSGSLHIGVPYGLPRLFFLSQGLSFVWGGATGKDVSPILRVLCYRYGVNPNVSHRVFAKYSSRCLVHVTFSR